MKILSQSDTVRLKLQEQMKWTGAYKPTEKGNPKEEKPTVEAHFLYMELREAVLWTQNNPLFITGWQDRDQVLHSPRWVNWGLQTVR